MERQDAQLHRSCPFDTVLGPITSGLLQSVTVDRSLDLDEAWPLINERIGQVGLVRYPAWISGENAVRWDGEDWRGFLDAAVTCGASLIYVQQETMGPDDLRLISDAIAEDEVDPTPELLGALSEASGRIGAIQLGFSHGGVVHVWDSPAAAWFLVLAGLVEPEGALSESDARYRRNRARYDEDEAAEARSLGPQIEAWIALVAEHPRYVAAKNQELRRAIACELVPEVDLWSRMRQSGMAASPENSARQRAAWDVLQRSEHRLTEVKALRLADAKDHADEWADELRKDSEFVHVIGSTERRRSVGEFVERRLGFPSADVRDRILSRLRS